VVVLQLLLLLPLLALREVPRAVGCCGGRRRCIQCLQFFEDLPHDWKTTHQAWNGGKYDAWVPNKGTSTMAYLVRNDIPFHYALADAFTVCDAYHCSFLGPTDPNRYHLAIRCPDVTPQLPDQSTLNAGPSR